MVFRHCILFILNTTSFWNRNLFRIRTVWPLEFKLFLDPKQATKERGEKKLFGHTLFCNNKFYNIVNYFVFEMLKKEIWANFQRIIELCTQKIVTKLSKIWVWAPGSGKNLFRIPRGQKGTGSRIPDRDPGHTDFCTAQWTRLLDAWSTGQLDLADCRAGQWLRIESNQPSFLYSTVN